MALFLFGLEIFWTNLKEITLKALRKILKGNSLN